MDKVHPLTNQSIEILKLLYDAIVQPHFDYSDILYEIHLKLISTD